MISTFLYIIAEQKQTTLNSHCRLNWAINTSTGQKLKTRTLWYQYNWSQYFIPNSHWAHVSLNKIQKVIIMLDSGVFHSIHIRWKFSKFTLKIVWFSWFQWLFSSQKSQPQTFKNLEANEYVSLKWKKSTGTCPMMTLIILYLTYATIEKWF